MNGLEGLYITTTISHTEARAGPFSGNDLYTCFLGPPREVGSSVAILATMSGAYFVVVVAVMHFFIKEDR